MLIVDAGTVHGGSGRRGIGRSSGGQEGGTAELSGVELAPELTRYLVYLMRRVFVHVSANSDRSTQSRDFAVLAAVADRLEITRTIMVKLIDRLQAEGYLIRERDPDNRRRYLLSLTDPGREALV